MNHVALVSNLHHRCLRVFISVCAYSRSMGLYVWSCVRFCLFFDSVCLCVSSCGNVFLYAWVCVCVCSWVYMRAYVCVCVCAHTVFVCVCVPQFYRCFQALLHCQTPQGGSSIKSTSKVVTKAVRAGAVATGNGAGNDTRVAEGIGAGDHSMAVMVASLDQPPERVDGWWPHPPQAHTHRHTQTHTDTHTHTNTHTQTEAPTPITPKSLQEQTHTHTPTQTSSPRTPPPSRGPRGGEALWQAVGPEEAGGREETESSSQADDCTRCCSVASACIR